MKIFVSGNTVSLVSALKLADIRTLERFDPDALTVTDDGIERFRIAAANNGGGINRNGVVFCSVCADGSGKAVHSFLLDQVLIATGADVKELVADAIGAPAVAYIERIEAQAQGALAAYESARSNLIDSITMVAE